MLTLWVLLPQYYIAKEEIAVRKFWNLLVCKNIAAALLEVMDHTVWNVFVKIYNTCKI
jgi:hypothetical protein